MNNTFATYRDYYEQEVEPYFGFLVSEFGFAVVLPPEDGDLREVVFAFRKGSREIALWLDQGVVPYVLMTLVDTKNGIPKVIRLDDLIRKHCPKRKVKRPKEWCGPETDISPFIRAYGSILADEFSEYLL